MIILEHAVVLAEGGMQQAFAGTGIAHIQRVAALDDVVFYEVVFHQGVNAFNADVRRNVAGFQVAHQGVDVNTVAHFHGDFAEVFVGAVHGVAQLQSGHVAPASLFEYLAGFGRTMVNAGVFGGIVTFAEHLDLAGQVDGTLVHDHLNSGMILFGDFPELFSRGGAFTHVNLFALKFLVFLADGPFFGDFHGGHDFVAFGIEEGDFVTDVDTGGFFIGDVQAHRNRPEGTIGHQKVFADAFPVCLGHESGQGAEAADADHDEVTFDATGNVDFGEAGGLCFFSFELRAFQQASGQAFAAMGGYELCHVLISFQMMFVCIGKTALICGYSSVRCKESYLIRNSIFVKDNCGLTQRRQRMPERLGGAVRTGSLAVLLLLKIAVAAPDIARPGPFRFSGRRFQH
jgi:hypothetical protein